MADDIKVIKKNIKLKATPLVGSRFSSFKPYRKVNSLAPTPPIVSGKTATTDEKRNRNRNSTIGTLSLRASIMNMAVINCKICTSRPYRVVCFKYVKKPLNRRLCIYMNIG